MSQALGNYRAPDFNNDNTTWERVEKFISDVYFLDCNLRGRLYGKTFPVTIKHVDFGSSVVSFSDAESRLAKQGEPVVSHDKNKQI